MLHAIRSILPTVAVIVMVVAVGVTISIVRPANNEGELRRWQITYLTDQQETYSVQTVESWTEPSEIPRHFWQIEDPKVDPNKDPQDWSGRVAIPVGWSIEVKLLD